MSNMTSEQFVSCIRKELLEMNLSMYMAEMDGSGGVHWPRLKAFYTRLDDISRQDLSFAIRQVMVDTISNLLGILDGSSLLNEYRDEFHLRYDGDSKDLNGQLQDLFLEAEEIRNRK